MLSLLPPLKTRDISPKFNFTCGRAFKSILLRSREEKEDFDHNGKLIRKRKLDVKI